MVSFTDCYNAVSIDRLPSKTKIRKDKWYFNNVSPNSPQLQRLFFNLKHTEKHSSARDCWGNTKSSFIENVRTFSKNSTTQENIKILKLKEVCKTYSKRKL